MRVLRGEGFTVEEVFEVFEVTRDAYYKRNKRRKHTNAEEESVLKLVRVIREDEKRVGTRKLKDRLMKLGTEVGRDTLFSLLRNRKMLIQPKKSYVKTTYSKHGYAVAPNRIEEMQVHAAKQVLVSDITYIRMRGKQKSYLFLVTDMYSRQIVGFHVSRDLSHYSALIALEMAVDTLGDVTGTIHHSDRGCQYCCHEYLRYLREHNILSSMTDENHCYQNAIAERVNGILKDEFDLDAVFDNIKQLKLSVAQAVMVYNTKRTHWSLGLLTPKQVYEQAA